MIRETQKFFDWFVKWQSAININQRYDNEKKKFTNKEGVKVDMIGCLQRIEQERQELHNLVEQFGFSDLRVLVKSQQLDQTLNEYNQYRVTYNAMQQL